MRRALIVGLLVVLVAGCSSSSGKSALGAISSAASSTGPQCIAVSGAARSNVGVEATSAVPGPIGYFGSDRWYYAASDGAVWIVPVNPTTGKDTNPPIEDPSDVDHIDLIVPLDSQARRDSRVGIAQPVDGQMAHGASRYDHAALQAISCAHESAASS